MIKCLFLHFRKGALEEQRKHFEEEIKKLRLNTPIDTGDENAQNSDGRTSLTTSGYGSRMSDREGSNLFIHDDRAYGNPDFVFEERCVSLFLDSVEFEVILDLECTIGIRHLRSYLLSA